MRGDKWETAACRESGEFVEDESGVRIEGESCLEGFEVDQLSIGGRREEKGGGKARGDEGFAEGGVGSPDDIGWVRNWDGRKRFGVDINVVVVAVLTAVVVMEEGENAHGGELGPANPLRCGLVW